VTRPYASIFTLATADYRVDYTTLVDDTSGLISYTGDGWVTDGLPRLELYQNQTVHHTATLGDSYSVKFVSSQYHLPGQK
jgi:hypothetical protein